MKTTTKMPWMRQLPPTDADVRVEALTVQAGDAIYSDDAVEGEWIPMWYPVHAVERVGDCLHLRVGAPAYCPVVNPRRLPSSFRWTFVVKATARVFVTDSGLRGWESADDADAAAAVAS